MTNDEKLMQWLRPGAIVPVDMDTTRILIESLRTRLAQPEPEPMAWMWTVNNGGGYYSRGIGFEQTDIPFAKHTPLYTAPPQREWQGLTDEEAEEVAKSVGYNPLVMTVYEYRVAVQRATEAKLKEKNNG